MAISPFLPGGSGHRWPPAVAAVIVAVAVLLLLVRFRKADLAHRETDTRLRGEVSRVSEWVQEQANHLRQQTDQLSRQEALLARQEAQLSRQEAQLSAQGTELNAQSAQITDLRDAHDQLLAECAVLREARATVQDQLDATRQAVEHMARERIPAALDGQEIPGPEAEGADAQTVKLLDEAVARTAQIGDRQESMRSAVVALSRRVQSAAHRIQEEATLLADRHPGDAGVLDVSMRIDHAAAQQARNAQSVAVLCGEWPGQQWPEPLPLIDVVRAAAGRIIAYRRIEVAGDPDIAAATPVVEPMIHLIAELLANATQSSPPATQVPVTVRAVQRGAVIEIHDCGIGLDDYRLARARDIASGITHVTLTELGEIPQTGLAVVGHYVRRHGLRVDISESVYGGVRAVVGIPTDLVEIVSAADTLPAPVIPEARPVEPPPAPDPPSTRADGEGPVLPRRRSPRHAGTRDSATRDSATRDSRAAEIIGSPAEQQAYPAAQPSPEETSPEETSPEEAGAWMGAFLSDSATDGNSPERGDQEAAKRGDQE
ncbi:MAG: hypothetical protein J2P26_04435 [Nocardiopsaceae bacterium]|nr:hypothetical protein [Nocardiopsaceae bacterium]